jgi:hypothetical protein
MDQKRNNITITNADVQAKIHEQEINKTRSPAPLARRRPSQSAPSSRDAASTPVMTGVPSGAATRAPVQSVKLNGARRRLTLGSRQSVDTPSTKQSADATITPTDPPLAMLTSESAADPESAPANATATTKLEFAPRTPIAEGGSTRRWKSLATIIDGEFTVIRKSLADFNRNKIPGITEAMINKAWDTNDPKMVVGGVHYYVLSKKQISKFRKIASARKSARKSSKK